MSAEAARKSEESVRTPRFSGNPPVETPVIARGHEGDQEKKEATLHNLEEHAKKHGHDDHGHGGSEFGKKVEKAVGGTFAVTGGAGALMVEPGTVIAAKIAGPAFGAKVALFGLTILKPVALLLGYPQFIQWVVNKTAELAGSKVPAASKSGGHDDHVGGH